MGAPFEITHLAGLNRMKALVIARSEFGSLYGSGKLFRFLGKHIVNGHIHLNDAIHVYLND